ESGRKSKSKHKYLTPVAIPYWIVQVSDTKSIVIAANGESSITVNLSEDTALGPVRRILTSEAKDYSDIPDAVDNALPMIRDVEPKVHHVNNLQEPKIFTAQGKFTVEVDPNEKISALKLKIDSKAALNISRDFQKLIRSAEKRLRTMEEFQTLTKERLTDRMVSLDNVIASEMARWEKRYKTLETNTELRIDKLKEKRSTTIYRLKGRRIKDQARLIAGFVRESVELERFFTKIADDVTAFRLDIKGEADLDAVVQKYQSLVDHLDGIVPDYTQSTDSVSVLAGDLLLQSQDLDDVLDTKTKDEDDTLETQIIELQERLIELKEEIEEKDTELQDLKHRVASSVNRIDELVEKRVQDLRLELQKLVMLTLENESFKDLAPLTLFYIKTYVVTYNKGAPVVLAPVMSPTDRVSLPYKHEPFNPDLETYLQKSIKSHLKSSPSFKTEFESTRAEGNIFYNPESIGLFKKGIGDLWTRQLLIEGIREKLEPMFVKRVGRCPKCGGEIGATSKFCPECGVSLLQD
ncbi:MAG: zinc ribbon domain-containing protein, partial [Candidatus Thorarchaeota archaeon]